jgi:hypothetical protein
MGGASVKETLHRCNYKTLCGLCAERHCDDRIPLRYVLLRRLRRRQASLQRIPQNTRCSVQIVIRFRNRIWLWRLLHGIDGALFTFRAHLFPIGAWVVSPLPRL